MILVGSKVKTEGPIAATKALEHTMQLKWTKNVQLYNLHSSKPEFLVWIESGYHLHIVYCEIVATFLARSKKTRAKPGPGPLFPKQEKTKGSGM